jgi:hypothetical protein
MKLFCALTAFAAFATVNPQLHEVKRVYILPMSASMDQYMADQLTEAGVFEVVTDPKKADAIITDDVGQSFETKLDDLYPPRAPTKSAEETKDTADRAYDSPKKLRDLNSVSARPSTTVRGRGHIFVVSISGRAVLWSIYEPTKNNSSGELTKTAEHVVKHLQEAMNSKNLTTE